MPLLDRIGISTVWKIKRVRESLKERVEDARTGDDARFRRDEEKKYIVSKANKHERFKEGKKNKESS